MPSIDDLISAEEKVRDDRRLSVERQTRLAVFAVIALVIFWGTLISIGIRRQILGVAKVYQDVNADLKALKRDLEERVEDRTAALTAANSELEAFCYSVSHDLRAPLRGIDGFSQALLEDYGSSLDNRARQYLGFVREGVQKMGKLIDDLLDLSRLSRMELKRQPVSLAAIAAEIVGGLRKAEPGREVRFDNIAASAGDVQGDPGLLSAMLENLISNAWKFTARKSPGHIEFGSEKQGEERVFFLRDNGAGFDMAFEGKLFGAFQRLHSVHEFKGTGVGLATVRRIIHRHGGRIWARGAVDQGATFFFTLS